MGVSTLRPDFVSPVAIREVVAGLGISGDAGNVVTTGVCLDSRLVRPRDLYVALPGFHSHGAAFSRQAVERGAIAILTDPAGVRAAGEAGVPVLVSERLRPVMAEVSARIYGEPASGLELFGVTGTNGKTTTVALLEATLAATGRRVGTIGTLGFRLDCVALPSGRSTVTTPDSPDLQALLALMRERGAQAVAIEVSSHAMAMSRADALRFDVVAFLNLGRDHLDFHRDMEEYFEAKASLFTPEHARAAVVWIDDENGCRVADRARKAGLPVTTVGTREEADYRLMGYEPVLPLGGRARLRTASGETTVELALPGWHNMVDAAIALAMLERVGISVEDVLPGLARAQVPGRMQVLPLPEMAPTVVVDFAHTPQAVAATLDALQGFSEVITVVGCGGDRDPDKRPLMGRAAAERSDVLIITDDNPRTEDPASIRAAMLAGTADSRARIIEAGGRGGAIELALATAGRDSVVAILGKGHEQGQQIGDRIVAFDDALVALETWRRMEGSGR